MLFKLRVLFSLAFSVSLISVVLAQSQSSAPNSPQGASEAAVRAVVQKFFVLYSNKDLDGLMRLWSENSPDYPSLKQNLQRQFTSDSYQSSLPTIAVQQKQVSIH